MVLDTNTIELIGIGLEIILSPIIAYLIGSFELYKKRQKEAEALREIEAEAIRLGLQSLLRDRIIQSYNYYTEKKWIPIYALESILNCYDNYEKLGANGVINTLIDQIKALPNHPPKEETEE